jgi:hypothetical protein
MSKTFTKTTWYRWRMLSTWSPSFPRRKIDTHSNCQRKGNVDSSAITG